MPEERQIRGMLLEEVVLHLLRMSGYRPVTEVQGDRTLRRGGAGLEVRGRGAWHQIDAIADFMVHPPFSNPQRLLLEAKFLSPTRGVSLAVVRNALGTLRDVSEAWTFGAEEVPHNARAHRYHYEYAIFSANRYSSSAQQYAYAQDIFLIPLGGSAYFQPVLRSIERAAEAMKLAHAGRSLGDWRRMLRQSLLAGHHFVSLNANNPLTDLVIECMRLSGALLGTLGSEFPVFLAPAENVFIDRIPPVQDVHIYWDELGWYLRSPDGRNLFSFDLPTELFERYADRGRLQPQRALDLKEQVMADIQAVRSDGTGIELLRFRLDRDWLQQIRQNLNRGPRE